MTIAIPISQLTSLEVKTIDLIAKGKSNKQIADSQNCSINTIQSRVRNIYYKLNSNNRAETVAKAIKIGILSVLMTVAQYHAASVHDIDLDFARLQRTGRRGGSRWESSGFLSPSQIITA